LGREKTPKKVYLGWRRANNGGTLRGEPLFARPTGPPEVLLGVFSLYVYLNFELLAAPPQYLNDLVMSRIIIFLLRFFKIRPILKKASKNRAWRLKQPVFY
jgi:hypothetical protein